MMAACVALLFASCGKRDYVFRIGMSGGSLCGAPEHVAETNGYFREEFAAAGMKYELVDIPMPEAPALIAAGKIDGAFGLSGILVPQIDNGLEAVFTGGLHTGCTKFLVKPDSDINGVEDFRGKKIGVPGIGDSSVVAAKRRLSDYGISTSIRNPEVEFIGYDMNDLALALANGAVDVIAMHDPVGYNAVQEYGYRVVFDLTTDEKFSREYCCQIVVSAESAEKYPKAAAAFTRALFKGAAFAQAEPREAARIQIDNGWCPGDLDTNAEILGSYNYTPSVEISYQTVIDSAKELTALGEFNSTDFKAFADEHFAFFAEVPNGYIYENGVFKEIPYTKKD